MREPMKKYFRTGLVHFMAYPFAMTGEGEIERSVRRVLEDDYFDFIELTRIADAGVRQRVAKLAREADVGIAGGDKEGLVFAHGEILRKVPQDRLVEELMLEIEKL